MTQAQKLESWNSVDFPPPSHGGVFVFVELGCFFISRGENTDMYLLVFVFPGFPSLPGIVSMLSSSSSFFCVAEMKTKQS